MNSYIRITRIPYEEPYHINLMLEVSNGSQKSVFEYYSGANSLIEIADALEMFPQHKDSVFLHEVGSEREEDKWAYYFRFRVFTTNATGHCAIQFRFNNNKKLPDREISEFCIKAESSQINRLGQLFRGFARLQHEVLEWSVTKGELLEFANKA